MRQLTINEVQNVSGADNHGIVFIDPVAAIQTLAFLVSHGDAESFGKGSVVTGMLGGAAAGGFLGYGAATGVLCAGATIGGAAAGAIAGGVAGRIAATFSVAAYNAIMA